jgi:hypothetical protein
MSTQGKDVRSSTADFLRGLGIQQPNIAGSVGQVAQQVGRQAVQKVAPMMGQVSNQFANMGLTGAATGLQAGGAALNSMGAGGLSTLGGGLLGAGVLGAIGAGAALAHKSKQKERMAGQNLGAQLGVQMPGAY